MDNMSNEGGGMLSNGVDWSDYYDAVEASCKRLTNDELLTIIYRALDFHYEASKLEEVDLTVNCELHIRLAARELRARSKEEFITQAEVILP